MIEQLESRRLMSSAPMPFSALPPRSVTPAAVVAAPVNLSLSFGGGGLAASVVAGTRTHAVVLLNAQNTDATRIASRLTFTLYAVPEGGSIDSTTAKLASTPPAVWAFAGNAQRSINLLITSIPATLTDGNYNIQAQVTDAQGNVVATSPTGPAFAVAQPTITLQEKQLFATIPSAVKSGVVTPVLVKMFLGNNGNVPTTKPTKIEILASPDGLPGDAMVLTTHSQFYRIVPGGVITVPVLVREFDLPDGTYKVFARSTDQFGDVTYSGPDLSVTVAPAVYQLSVLWHPKLELGNFGGVGNVTLDTSGTAFVTNTGRDPIVGPLTVNVYVARNDSYGTTNPQPVSTPPASLPFKTFQMTVHLLPHQRASIPIQTSIPDAAGANGGYFQYTLGIVDPHGGVTYYVNPQPAAG
jgi:hypothetical protein